MDVWDAGVVVLFCLVFGLVLFEDEWMDGWGMN